MLLYTKSKNYKNNCEILFYGTGILLFLIIFRFSYALEPDTLKQTIEKNSQELQRINQEIKDNQQVVQNLQGQGKTLKTEIKKIDTNLKQLQLSITASNIIINRSKLEIDSTTNDITTIQSQLNSKKGFISEMMRQLSIYDQENYLVILLKHSSFADFLSVINNISDISKTTSNQIIELQTLQQSLQDKKEIIQNKKNSIEQETAALNNKASITQSLKEEKNKILADTKDKESIYSDKLTKLEQLKKQIADEIEKLDYELRKQVNPNTLPPKISGTLQKPVMGVLTQGYGSTQFAKNGYTGQWHNGVDLAAPIGTPVASADDGTIVAAGNQDAFCYRGAYGKYIVIKHNNSLTTLYGHLSLVSVHVDDIVKRGQIIGYSGETGYATGPHLHFTVFDSNTFVMKESRVCGPMPIGGDVNPLNYL